MVKRWDPAYTASHPDMVPDKLGDYVTHDDYQAMRRRLVVKLLRERSYHLYWNDNDKDRGVVVWCRHIADAIESGGPLGYFRKLGGDK